MNRNLIVSSVVILLVLLFVTKSLYVEYLELFFIISVIWVCTLAMPKRLGWIASFVVSFISCFLFGILDLIIDHFLYFLESGKEDGAPLPLGFKLEEYSDDLFIASLNSMVVVTVLITSFKLIRNKSNNTL